MTEGTDRPVPFPGLGPDIQRVEFRQARVYVMVAAAVEHARRLARPVSFR